MGKKLENFAIKISYVFFLLAYPILFLKKREKVLKKIQEKSYGFAGGVVKILEMYKYKNEKKKN